MGMDNFTDEGRIINLDKKKRFPGILAVIGCGGLFLLLIMGSVVLYLYLDASLKETKETSTAQQVSSAEVLYTKEQMEESVEAAVAEAVSEARKEGAKEVLDSLEEGINSDLTMVEVLRSLYTDKLVVASGGKYHFVPISDSLKKNNLVESGLQLKEDGTIEYAENGNVISYKGIDVSKHQGEIDWEKVAADGVSFAFIRVGFRGYGSGALVEDECFEENIKGAISNGIQVGVYFFTQAVSEEEAREEAAFVLEKIAPYKVQGPVVLDVEKVSDSEARMNKISTQERTDNTITFLETIKEAGYEVMLYHNMEMGLLMLDLERLEQYDKWFAYYKKEIYYPYAFSVWQYSDKGVVDGITGNVDLNISFQLWD